VVKSRPGARRGNEHTSGAAARCKIWGRSIECRLEAVQAPGWIYNPKPEWQLSSVMRLFARFRSATGRVYSKTAEFLAAIRTSTGGQEEQGDKPPKRWCRRNGRERQLEYAERSATSVCMAVRAGFNGLTRRVETAESVWWMEEQTFFQCKCQAHLSIRTRQFLDT